MSDISRVRSLIDAISQFFRRDSGGDIIGVNISRTDVDKAIFPDTIGAGGSSAWGGITGTLSDQTDLQNELDTKLTQQQIEGLI
jgi:hypothetical protein